MRTSHLRRPTLPQLGSVPGFVDAWILKRKVGRGVEFLVITRWKSLQAIQAFAGDDAEVAVLPDEVRRMMLEYDPRARHYDVVD